MDFVKICTKIVSQKMHIYSKFILCRSKDLLIKGGKFYGFWNERKKCWSKDIYEIIKEVDYQIDMLANEYEKNGEPVIKDYLSDISNRSYLDLFSYFTHGADNEEVLDDTIFFANSDTKKEDFSSKKLSYSITDSECPSFKRLMDVLYDEEDRRKLIWSIGCVLSGDSKKVQKFIVIYGEPGSGKSTFLNILEKLFESYAISFDAKALGESQNQFSLSVFKDNPLVAIQHDGDLSKIESNARLNSLVSHETLLINEKNKAAYPMKLHTFLYLGTNNPVKITDAKSGLIRRLLDVSPSGRKIESSEYDKLISRIPFELGGIANFCLSEYNSMGPRYYDGYTPSNMIFKTDFFFNFMESIYLDLDEDGCTLASLYTKYKEYCEESNYSCMPKFKVREELKNYFAEFYPVKWVDNKTIRNYYSGLIVSKFEAQDIKPQIVKEKSWLYLKPETYSTLETELKDSFAQYSASVDGVEKPQYVWANVKTKLSDLDPTKLHYLKVPLNHIVIDFDLKNESGSKSLELNLAAAKDFPQTYAEVSKSGQGLHLHYIYDGNVDTLSSIYSENVEIKVFRGNASLRRKLSLCNGLEVSHISSGLPLKGEKVVDFKGFENEKHLRANILRNLKKEYIGFTAPSVGLIKKSLDEAYATDGFVYDVSDLRNAITSFAMSSTNQADTCLKLVNEMRFKSEDVGPEIHSGFENEGAPIVIFDCEVFKNLFIVCWKYFRDGTEKVTRMINPSPEEITALFKYRLVGFNCRKYDNHILYARSIGYTLLELYKLSKRITKEGQGFFPQAYRLSYTDIYEFSSKKQSLKKFEIELGIHHQELGFDWDSEIPEDKWELVADYCCNDVIATEKTWESRIQDWNARIILTKLSGLSANHTTQQHAAKIIFGNEKNPQKDFNYPDLSKEFPGYKFENGKSSYREVETGEGGYVLSEPGVYFHAALLDIASMHPTTIEILQYFGPYTKVFSDIKQARIALKHHDMESLKTLLDGKLVEFAEDCVTAEDWDDLSYSMKIIINIVYGLTMAKSPSLFRDPRNVDNVVAKRGALFMVDLYHAVTEKGYKLFHIKTDSVKIANADDYIINFVMEFGKKYGYTFEHECTYEKICLVNDAVYIAKYDDKGIRNKGGKHANEWTATGVEFSEPFVFKTLFTHEDIKFDDMCSTFNVQQGAIYLDQNEHLPEGEHEYNFIGKTGRFCPVVDGANGGYLLRVNEDKYSFVGGTKGYRWLETEEIIKCGKENLINVDYYNIKARDAYEHIAQFCDPELFTENDYNDLKDRFLRS